MLVIIKVEEKSIKQVEQKSIKKESQDRLKDVTNQMDNSIILELERWISGKFKKERKNNTCTPYLLQM